jgi:hypothetical protein
MQTPIVHYRFQRTLDGEKQHAKGLVLILLLQESIPDRPIRGNDGLQRCRGWPVTCSSPPGASLTSPTVLLQQTLALAIIESIHWGISNNAAYPDRLCCHFWMSSEDSHRLVPQLDIRADL